MTDPGDLELIRRFQRGDRSSFDTLVDRYLDRVAGVSKRFLNDAHEAQDVTQDTFLALYQVLPSWKPDAALFTWLYRTAVNLSLKRARQRARPLPVPAQPQAPEPAGPVERLQALDDALAELSDRQREVFLLCHEQQVPLADIARRLGISLGATKSHLHRALSTLRDKLKGRALL
jgi:RNA polymerase sigma-70 factor (ECF subfamily)